jgi:hypothetical protein
MFRKIHSNRDPRDTLVSELKKEFSVYVAAFSKVSKSVILRYPRTLFACMIGSLLVSVLFAIILHRPSKVVVHHPVDTQPFQDGFNRITAAGMALNETIRLKKHVDSLMQKQSLSSVDSTALLKGLDSLRHIRMQLNP